MSRGKDQKREIGADPVRLRIYDNLFSAVAEEMGAALGRLGFSQNIKERRDYSTALFDGGGAMVAQAAHIPVHLGSMPLSVSSTLDALKLEAGDIALVNDPFEGGTHLPDLTLVAPVFLPGKGATRGPAFFVANRAHHADVGGMAGGSMAPSREIYQEGLRIPPVKLVAGGKPVQAVWRLLLANMRNPREREGDLAAQLAAIRVGERRILELTDSNGVTEVTAFASHIQDYAERLMRSVVASVPNGRYEFEDYLDDHEAPESGAKPRPLRIRVAITVRGTRATVDFAGTSEQMPGNLNANRAIALSAVFYVFRCLGGESMPSNAGCLRPIEVRTPPGSLVDARAPAAVAAGNVETSQRIVDVLLGALARALPDRLPAASQGTMNNLTIAGRDPFRQRSFTYYETMGGGAGALAQTPGATAVHSHMTNTLNTPVEALETSYPFRVLTYEVRRRSGGRGRQRGGDGIVRELELLAPAEVTFTAERRTRGPYGLDGGSEGRPGRAWLIRGTVKKRLAGKFHLDLQTGDRLRIETPGGGAYGACV